MNDFVRSLKADAFKKNDVIIKETIIHLFEKIRSEAEVEEYGLIIEDRKKGIEKIFENFNFNMGVIEEKQKEGSKEPINYEHSLDHYLLKEIKHHSEDIYDQMLKRLPKDDKIAVEMAKTQLMDRINKLGILFKDYDTNMKILDEYKKNVDGLDELGQQIEYLIL